MLTLPAPVRSASSIKTNDSGKHAKRTKIHAARGCGGPGTHVLHAQGLPHGEAQEPDATPGVEGPPAQRPEGQRGSALGDRRRGLDPLGAVEGRQDRQLASKHTQDGG